MTEDKTNTKEMNKRITTPESEGALQDEDAAERQDLGGVLHKTSACDNFKVLDRTIISAAPPIAVSPGNRPLIQLRPADVVAFGSTMESSA